MVGISLGRKVIAKLKPLEKRLRNNAIEWIDVPGSRLERARKFKLLKKFGMV